MSNRPSHIVYAVFKTEGEKDRWQAIGALWPHKGNDGFSVKLPLIPRDGNVELVIRENKAKPDTQGRPVDDIPF
jgi:hypothetical protein